MQSFRQRAGKSAVYEKNRIAARFFADAIRQIMLVMAAFLFSKGYHDKEQGEKCGQVYRHQLQADMICNQSENRRHKRRTYICACHLNANNPL